MEQAGGFAALPFLRSRDGGGLPADSAHSECRGRNVARGRDGGKPLPHLERGRIAEACHRRK